MKSTPKYVISFLLTAWTAFGQEVIVDWMGKKITSQPSSVEKTVRANVRVDNVNDLMFTYSISYTVKPLAISDFDSIAKAFAIAGQAAKAAGESPVETQQCNISRVTDSQKALADAEEAFLNSPATNAGCSVSKPCDITLGAANDLWRTSVQPKINSAQTLLSDFTARCATPSNAAAIKLAGDAISSANAKFNSPHTILKTAAVELSPEGTTSLEVDQFWMGTATTNGTYSVDLQSSNHRLTLSAGALFSEIQNRAYSSKAAPSTSTTGTGTTNVLAVDGLSKFNPTAVALLNYEIPLLDWEQIGFALSTGPVFRLGSKSDTSSFGYFAGVSVHLYHRFYISPGFHFGQFSDFPAGFSQINQTVPSGLATPIGTNRWTWRFGFGLSYKTKDFSQFSLSGSVTPTQTTTPGGK